PYPPNFSLSDYNNGNILVKYYSVVPYFGNGQFGTSPTNAGYVPYSPQVMYARRGFGYSGSQSASTGNLVVPMTSAGQAPTASSVAAAIGQFST
ncbi:type IV fimbrial biogenesis PilY1-related protein, partial [mine drainage metagenome]